jgi:3'(2'), 5'-bisphosphate nucleotidase
MAEGTIPAFEGRDFWLIDALDGTKEFVKGGTDFTVNVALIQGGLPVLGVVHAPARAETYLGVVDPASAARRAEVRRAGGTVPLIARKRPSRVIVAGSRSHEIADEMNTFLDAYDVADRIVVGSSIKFCMVAEGRADLYPRFGPTSEWDTAAGHAVLRAAGGRVHTFDGVELAYKKPSYLNARFLAEGPQ